MKREYQAQFCQLRVGAKFYRNGYAYTKRSLRTGEMSYGGFSMRLFFRKGDLVATFQLSDIIQEGIWTHQDLESFNRE